MISGSKIPYFLYPSKACQNNKSFDHVKNTIQHVYLLKILIQAEN
jgi:hypothetical protein